MTRAAENLIRQLVELMAIPSVHPMGGEIDPAVHCSIAQAHTADEWMEVVQMERAVEILTSFVEQYLSQKS